MQVWLDGQFVSFDDAKVSVFDAGFQHAVGLFETMAARNGRVYRAEQHIERLVNSARDLLLSERLHAQPLIDAVHQAIAYNELVDARVRLTVTGGNLGRPRHRRPEDGDDAADPTILIVPQPPTPYPEAYFRDGVRVAVADGRANPLDPIAGHKTLAYWPRIQALQIASLRSAQEALWFTVSNHLASGSVSNIFLVKDGRLLTPIARGEEEHGAMPAPVLPGITRAVIRERADDLRIDVETRMLDIEELLGADEVFLTNSSWGVLPVVAIEKEAVADGAPGRITNDLRDAWLADVERKTSQG